MVLKIFICPSHIANWSQGLLESMGHDRHPIRALASYHYQKYLHMINKCHSIWKWATQKTRFRHNSCIGVYGKYLQVESREIKRWSIYWGMLPSIWKHLSTYAWSKTIVRLRHGSLHHSGQTEQGAWIETKEIGTNWRSLSALSDPCTRRGFWGEAINLSYVKGSF